MVYERYDFTRNPIVEGQRFFLESKCVRCGFEVLAPSIDQLLEEEKMHRTPIEPAPDRNRFLVILVSRELKIG